MNEENAILKWEPLGGMSKGKMSVFKDTLKFYCYEIKLIGPGALVEVKCNLTRKGFGSVLATISIDPSKYEPYSQRFNEYLFYELKHALRDRVFDIYNQIADMQDEAHQLLLLNAHIEELELD